MISFSRERCITLAFIPASRVCGRVNKMAGRKTLTISYSKSLKADTRVLKKLMKALMPVGLSSSLDREADSYLMEKQLALQLLVETISALDIGTYVEGRTCTT